MSLVKMCIKGALEARAAERVSLSKQKTTKIRKEDLFHDKKFLAFSEEYIYVLYCNGMFYSTA